MLLPACTAVALLAAVAAATITPSNTSTVDPRYFQGTLPLQGSGNGGQQIAELVPLTRQAAQQSIEGNLYRTNGSSVGAIAEGDIAYISCNPADYPGFFDAQATFSQAYGNGNANISGVILYSTATDYCDYTDASGSMQSFPVFSMTNKTDSAAVLGHIDDLAVQMKYFVQVQGRGSTTNSNDNNGTTYQPQGSTGSSPSTTVAMIVLYSITGIITALFLIIILTGAVRAHRHPERYGPRNVLGRPRQSRAKGLGRAILETIPIIKFGDKEPAKPADVELGSTRDATVTDDTTTPATDAAKNEISAATTETTREIPATPAATEQPNGISAAIAPAALVGASTTPASSDDTLGCTICTEDFEKGQDIRVLPCDHKFHPECVDPWLLNVSGTCPLCRVDLRPTKTNESTNSQANELAPPLNPEHESSNHRRPALFGILFFRSHPDASPEDRISALRRLREQRRGQSDDAAGGSADASAEDAARGDRRSRRISTRLGDVFSGRTRRGDSPSQPGGASSSAT